MITARTDSKRASNQPVSPVGDQDVRLDKVAFAKAIIVDGQLDSEIIENGDPKGDRRLIAAIFGRDPVLPQEEKVA